MLAAVTPGDSCDDYPHFAVEEIEAQRGECISQGPTGGGVEEVSNQRGSRALTLNHTLALECQKPKDPGSHQSMPMAGPHLSSQIPWPS